MPVTGIFLLPNAILNGNVAWVVTNGGPGVDFGQDIALDKCGYLYVTGLFSGTANFGDTSLTSEGAQDCFVVKYDTSGKLIWAERMGGAADASSSWPTGDRGIGIMADSSGNSYVTGQFNGASIFGTHLLTSMGSQDIFVVKINPSGNVLWALRGGGPNGSNVGQAIALDPPEQHIYTTGLFYGSGSFGTNTFQGYGNDDAYLVKLDTSGNILWVKVDGGSAGSYGYGVTVDENGNCFLAGAYSGTATFDTITTISKGGLDIFLAAYDSSGTVDTLISIGETGDELLHDVRCDRKGGVYIAGWFQNTINIGNGTLTSPGGDAILVAKLLDLSPPSTLPKKMPGIASQQQITVGGIICDTVAFDTLYVLNTGVSQLMINSWYFGVANDVFELVAPTVFPLTIAPGDSQQFVVRFTSSSGASSNTLNLINNDTLPGENPWKITFTGILAEISASLSISADSGKPGDIVYVPVVIHPLNQTQLAGVSCRVQISYNASILSPVGIINGEIDSVGSGFIIFTVDDAADPAFVKCIVGLGDTTATNVHIDTVEWECISQTELSDGEFALTGLCKQGGTRLFLADSGLSLTQNNPNPFGGTTTIQFRTIENGETRLWVADVLGREQALLVEGYRNAGSYEIGFDGNGLHAGIYFYILQTPTQTLRKTMVVEK